MAKHGKIKDSGAYFVIDPASRKVTVPHAHKAISTVGDHNSEQVTFECPKTIDGHDIALCDYRYVTWINVNGEVGHDELQIVQVDDGREGMIYLSWTIRNGLTVAKGVVQFSIHFECKEDNNIPIYRWSTTTCKDCEILDSINAGLGVYQSVYVVGNRLVFDDYNVVKDGVLKLETKGVIPEGILDINENGTYNVGKYAQVKVSVDESPPEISISKDGKVTARDGDAISEIQLSSEHDPNFIARNICYGVNIFGVDGTYDELNIYDGSIRYVSMHPIFFHMYYAGIDGGGLKNLAIKKYFECQVSDGDEYHLYTEALRIAKNTLITLIVDKPFNNLDVQVTVSNGELLQKINDNKSDKAIFVIKTGVNPHIEISDGSIGMG